MCSEVLHHNQHFYTNPSILYVFVLSLGEIFIFYIRNLQEMGKNFPKQCQKDHFSSPLQLEFWAQETRLVQDTGDLFLIVRAGKPAEWGIPGTKWRFLCFQWMVLEWVLAFWLNKNLDFPSLQSESDLELERS